MEQWMVDEQDEYEDAGPKIGQYDSPTLFHSDGKNSKSLSKKASKIAINDQKPKIKKVDDTHIPGSGDNTSRSPKQTRF